MNHVFVGVGGGVVAADILYFWICECVCMFLWNGVLCIFLMLLVSLLSYDVRYLMRNPVEIHEEFSDHRYEVT